ncbi:MAG: hypothetical protein AAGB02_00965 [Pseudomonadota bacterium]
MENICFGHDQFAPLTQSGPERWNGRKAFPHNGVPFRIERGSIEEGANIGKRDLSPPDRLD